MRYLYYIKLSRGVHGDLFVFSSHQSAVEWCQAHTAWDNITILKNIKKIAQTEAKCFQIPF